MLFLIILHTFDIFIFSRAKANLIFLGDMQLDDEFSVFVPLQSNPDHSRLY